ncbi:MAG: fibronectin type III domain-containing protein [Proteobacteria bacterium]|nr:fibronectin type III domain-containing protein [Pseudomonadota bacterium]
MKLISHTVLGISCTLLLACTPFNSRQVSGANQSPGISSAPEAVQGSNTTTETKTSLEALSAPIPGDDAWLQLQKLNTGAVQVSWTAATSTSTQAELLYSVYMHKADGSSFDTVGTVEAGEKLVADQSSTQYTIKNLADSQSYEVNVIAKDKSGARSVYRPMSFSILAQVRSLDFTKELLAGQNLEFTAKDFTEHYVSRQARPLKSIRILSLPNNASLMLGSRELTLGETIEATNLYQLKLNFKSGSWTGDSSFEWQASDGSASSLSAGLVTARRLLSNISGFGQSKPVRANPLTGQISVRTFSDWPTGFTPGFTWNFQGAAWDGHYIWSTPRAGPMFVKIDTRTGAMSSLTDYPSGFSLNVNGMASAIFDGDSIWALPLGANAILRIGKDAKSMTMLNNYPSGYMTSGLWMHSGIFDGTKIWAAPCSANSILSIDKSSLAMTLNPIGASGEQSIARCSQSFFDGRYLWTTPNIESWGKTDVLTGQAAPALMSPLVQNHMIDGENIWAIETNLAAIRKTKISTGEVTRYFDWTGGGTAYPGSGCVFYDGRYYWTHTAPSIVQFDTQSGKGIGNYTLPSFINPAVQTSTRGCIFDGENLWLIPISGTMVYKISASRPSTSPSEILLAANKTFNFDSEIFKGAFHDPNQLPLARIIIQQLPQHGRLSLGKTALQAGAVIPEAKLVSQV